MGDYRLFSSQKVESRSLTDYKDKAYVLIRSVIVFPITEKTLSIKKDLNLYTNNSFELNIILKTPFKDGERVKSINGVDLITIEIVSKIKQNNSILKPEIDFIKFNNHTHHFARLLNREHIPFKEANSNNNDGENIYLKTEILVKNNELIDAGTTIAHTQILCQANGIVEKIPDKFKENRRIIITTEEDIKELALDEKSHNLKNGDWVKIGDKITKNITASHSGKIIACNNKSIKIQLARPYLISHGSIVYVNNNDLVQRGENLAVLVFERTKTGDIVQGLPRIEEILEARKKNDSPLNPHELLGELFSFYTLEGLNLNDAARLSLQDIQQILVNEIQVVYQSQGVDISDKHIEVIVRQMTNKVQIEHGGESNFLPGEIVDLHRIESINKNLELASKKTATYFPILMGITKASLNTDSFISAASFQETTKVLTEAAIAGKLDWLKGLKENVIIGRLIPAGTGFDVDSNINVY
jgi:DNA-directed RNA polymerase subunit beta'